MRRGWVLRVRHRRMRLWAAVECGILASVDRLSPGRLAGPRLLVGNSGAAAARSSAFVEVRRSRHVAARGPRYLQIRSKCDSLYLIFLKK